MEWSGVEWSAPEPGEASEERFSKFGGVTRNSMVSNTNSLRNHPIWAPEPGGSILEVPGRWCESDL